MICTIVTTEYAPCTKLDFVAEKFIKIWRSHEWWCFIFYSEFILIYEHCIWFEFLTCQENFTMKPENVIIMRRNCVVFYACLFNFLVSWVEFVRVLIYQSCIIKPLSPPATSPSWNTQVRQLKCAGVVWGVRTGSNCSH